jgi:hypothetical protein
MDFPDWLHNGSEFHIAERRGANTLRLKRAAETPECWAGFNRFVDRAIAEKAKWGYEVETHTSSKDTGGYDVAVIFFE